MPVVHWDRCFGCGDANPAGLRMHLETDGAGRAQARVELREGHQGPPGWAHGGLLATALDEAAALLTAEDDTPALTVRLEIDYRKPAAIGSTLRLEAEIERTEGSKRWVRVVAYMEPGDGEAVAEAQALMVIPALKR